MSTIQYEDLNTFRGSCGYICPNEDVLLWREIVKGRHIRRAAGICSGGEVGFLALLPTVRDELVLVDHSYESLAYAMLKYLLLLERGYKDTKRLLSDKEANDELKAILAVLKDRLPADVLKASTKRLREHRSNYTYEYVEYGPEQRLQTAANTYDGSSLVRYWKSFPENLVKRAAEKLAKVRFVHGDMTDLIEQGPFDLFYMSNAHEHTTRHGKSPVLTNVAKLLKPGGLVVSTRITEGRRYYDAGERLPKGWTQVSESNASSCGYGWRYALYQVPA